MTKQDLWDEIANKNRELAQVKRELEDATLEGNKAKRENRDLVGKVALLESRNSNAGRAISAIRQQRAEALQALAGVVAALAASPESFRVVPPPAAKDEAPF